MHPSLIFRSCFGISVCRGSGITRRRLGARECIVIAVIVSVCVIFLSVNNYIHTIAGPRLKLADNVWSDNSGNSQTNYDDVVLIYNRVPKTGSTSFVGLAYDLCEKNRYNVLHLNVSKNNHVLSLADQINFVFNLTNWVSKKPALYHGHLAYLDFAKFGVTTAPLYINVIRNPLDRLVSYYYFIRNGDDFRPYLKRRKAGQKQTFDDCYAEGGSDCREENLWLQIPFFCGHAAECWVVGSEWALQMAKHNLASNYLLVGITEELGDFVAILEAVLPRYFLGATNLYNAGNRSHLRKTFNKVRPSKATVAKIRESTIWQMENEFYEFAREQFHFVKQRMFTYVDNKMTLKGQQFTYEKIRPRSNHFQLDWV